MSDDNPYDDAADDTYDESEPAGRAADGTPLFGTASKGNPVTGEVAYAEDDSNPVVTINPANQPARAYTLTERVKEKYEESVSNSLDRLDAEYYDMWWQGTTLHVEYSGRVRAPESRPGPNQSSASSQQGQQQPQDRQQGQGSPSQENPIQQLMQQSVNQQEQNQDVVLPREPQPPFSGRQGEVQVQFPIPQETAPDLGFFDEGLLPVQGFTEFDIQERAKAAPLSVEDNFVEPWSNEYPVQTPIDYDESKGAAEQEMFEVEDFRDKTDSKDTKLQEGKRGNRYHL